MYTLTGETHTCVDAGICAFGMIIQIIDGGDKRFIYRPEQINSTMLKFNFA